MMLNLNGYETDGVPAPSDVELAAADVMSQSRIPPIDPNSPHRLPVGWTLHDASYYGHTYARAPDGTTWHREEGRFIKPRQEWDRVNLDGVRSL